MAYATNLLRKAIKIPAYGYTSELDEKTNFLGGFTKKIVFIIEFRFIEIRFLPAK